MQDQKKYGTNDVKFEGGKMQYWKMRDQIFVVKNAGLKMQDWKMQDLKNAGHGIQISCSIYRYA